MTKEKPGNVIHVNFGNEVIDPAMYHHIGESMRNGTDVISQSLGQLMLTTANPKKEYQSQLKLLGRSFGSMYRYAQTYSNALSNEKSVPLNNMLNIAQLVMLGFSDRHNAQESRKEETNKANSLHVEDIRGSLVFIQTSKTAKERNEPFSIAQPGVVACFWSEHPEELRIISRPQSTVIHETTYDPSSLSQTTRIFDKQDSQSDLLIINRSNSSPYDITVSLPIDRVLPPNIDHKVTAQLWHMPQKY